MYIGENQINKKLKKNVFCINKEIKFIFNFVNKKMKNNLKNICIIRDDRLGDTILTLPIVKQIKKEYPNSQITLIISKISEDLIKLCDYVDKYLVFSNNKIINKINSQNFDLIINFSPIKNRTYKFFLNAKRKINIIYLSRYKRDNKDINF